jgi:acetyl esterase/lipase
MEKTKDDLSPLEKIFRYQHMSPTADSLMEAYDRDFIAVRRELMLLNHFPLTRRKQEMLKMNIRWEEIPGDTDYKAWRQWDRTEFFTYNRKPQCKPSRPVVEVKITDAQVRYSESDQFRIRVYEPQDGLEGKRPALLMYHGGGWSHGDPTNDEGAKTPLLKS